MTSITKTLAKANANLVKALVNNAWDKPVVTVKEAEKIVALAVVVLDDYNCYKEGGK